MEPRWLNNREMRAWVAFLDASNLLHRRIAQQLREDGGVTQPQYELLTRLEAAPGGRLRMTELAEALAASRSGLTYQVTQLEKAGFVRREPYEGDDRGVVATLTAGGREVLQAAAPGHVQVVREGLIDLLDEAELDALGDILGRVRDQLRQHGREHEAPSALPPS